MKYERKDITKLFDAGSVEDRKQLATYIDLSDDDKPTGEAISKQLWWKYQTPVGYALRTPTFDEISIAVANKFMKVSSVKNDASCWDILNKLCAYLMEKALKEGNSEEIKEAIEKIEVPGKKDLSKYRNWALLLNPFVISNQVGNAFVSKPSFPIAGTGFPLGSKGWTMMVFQLNAVTGTNWQNIIPTVIYTSYVYNRLAETGNLPF